MGADTSCMSNQNSHLDGKAVGGGKMGQGGDINDAVLQATQIGGGGLVQKVQLSISCTSLMNMDTMSKSDPFAIMYKRVGQMW